MLVNQIIEKYSVYQPPLTLTYESMYSFKTILKEIYVANRQRLTSCKKGVNPIHIQVIASCFENK